jgi:hypothetical protein
MNISIDPKSWFYRNCKRQRRNQAKICNSCPFRGYIERKEAAWRPNPEYKTTAPRGVNIELTPAGWKSSPIKVDLRYTPKTARHQVRKIMEEKI